MIRKSSSLVYASELLIDMANNETRGWVRRAYDGFWLWIAEEGLLAMQCAALCGKEDIRAFFFRMADDWLEKTDEGRAFAARVADEVRA